MNMKQEAKNKTKNKEVIIKRAKKDFEVYLDGKPVKSFKDFEAAKTYSLSIGQFSSTMSDGSACDDRNFKRIENDYASNGGYLNSK